MDSDPSEAADALQIARNSNVPASVAALDIEKIKQQQKAAIVASLLENNQTLRDYALGHPLAPKISANDWGQLDQVSSSLDKFHTFGNALFKPFNNLAEWYQSQPSWMQQAIEDTAKTEEDVKRLGIKGFLIPQAIERTMELAQGFGPADINDIKVDPKLIEAARIAEPYIRDGKVPPVGLHPLIDKFHAEQAKLDAANLDELVREAGRSETRSLAPEFFADQFLRRKTNASILVDADAVRKLYGDKVPAPDDNILGWVKGIQDQLAVAEEDGGGKIAIPIADWTAHIPNHPEVADALKDDIQFRPGGVTLNEAKELAQPLTMAERRPYENVPDELMGFAKDGSRQKGYEEQNYKFEQPVLVSIEGQKPFQDQIKGLNREHALERARRNWEGADIQAIESPPDPVSALRQQTKLQPPLTTEVSEVPRGLREVESGKGQTIIPAIERHLPSKTISVGRPGNEKAQITPIASFKVSDAIDMIDNKHLLPVPKAMYGFIGSQFKRLVGDVPIHVVSAEDMARMDRANGVPKDDPPGAALYDHNNKAIFLDSRFTGAPLYAFAAETVLHEAAHALTYESLERIPDLKKAVNELRGFVKQYLETNRPELAERYDYFLTTGIRGEIGVQLSAHEFMSGGWSHSGFQNALADIPITKELVDRLGITEGKSPTAWDGFKHVIRAIFERVTGKKFEGPTALDAVLRLGKYFEDAQGILRKVGIAEKQGQRVAQALPKAEAPRDLSSQIARLLGKGRGDKYLESMAARDAEDAAFQAKLAEARARQQQTSEWKANRQSMRTEVSEDIRQRPAIAADLFFRNGELYGEKIRKPHLDRAAVPAELRKAIPPDYLIDRGGIHPDAAAGFFGYQTGRSMLEDLARLHADREEAGLTPSAHLTSMIEAETDRRMTATYGTLDQSILEEAKDHILGPSELDRLHEEMMALDAIHQGGGGEQMSAAEQLAWNKQAVKARVRENVASGRYGKMGEISSDHFVDQIGRIGKRIEDALQDGEYHDAFKLSQQRLIAASAAAEVKKLERAQERFEKAVKNWRKREPSGLRQEDAIWIHQILSQIGLPARRSVQDLEQQRELISQHANLREYYNEVNKAHGTNPQDPDAMPAVQNLNIMEELFSSNWRKSVEEMTPEEFMGVYNSLKSIDNWGRNAKKTEVRGNKEDTEKVVSGLVERLKAAVADKPAAISAEDKSKLRTVGSLLLNPETWFNRLDLGNRLGPFNQLIVRPITEGQHTLRSLEREFAAKWRDLEEPKDYNAKIENTLFRDKDGDLIPMTKGNALAVLSNMGNKLQRAKLVLGWKIDEDVARGEQKIWDWLQKVGIGPEDLARAQKLGQIFSDAFERSEAAWVHTAGVAPARIELGAMHTPWGVTEEWYHPLIPDPLRKNVKLTADDMLNESGYYRPSPSHGYTKLRTGAIYPIDLSYDSIPFKLKQILNDAAMRIPITEVNKLVYHDNFQTAFKKYYGPEYASALDGWMKDVAGNRQWVPGNIKSVEAAISGIQRNLSILQIGFNMGTVAKHAPTAAIFSMSEVGFKNFANSLLHMLYELPGSRERWEFAMDNSEELRNRLHTPSDTLTTIHHEIFPTKTTRRDSFRDTLEKYGHMPVAYTDLYSAVAMWDAEYRRLGEEKPDMSHGDKVYLANTAVRRTHGSAILSNRAGVMRYPSALARLATPYYNFFSNALQRLYEQAWKSKLALQGRSLPEMTGFLEEKFKAGPQHIKSIIGGLMVFGIMPSLIEQMVDPLPQAPGESDVKHWAKILTRGPAAMIPAVRDAVNYLYEGHDPSLGLYGTVVRNITEPLKTNTYVRDPGKAILNINRAFGALTGLTVEHFGKAGQFTANVMDGKEHPKGMGDLFTGLWKGTLKPPKRQ